MTFGYTGQRNHKRGPIWGRVNRRKNTYRSSKESEVGLAVGSWLPQWVRETPVGSWYPGWLVIPQFVRDTPVGSWYPSLFVIPRESSPVLAPFFLRSSLRSEELGPTREKMGPALIACVCASFYTKPAKRPWMTFKTVSFKMLVSVIMFSSWYLSSTPSF